MKRKNIFIVCASLLTLVGVNAAQAGNRPNAVTLSVADAYYVFAGKRHLDNVNMPNIGLAYNFDKHWAVEGNVGLLNTTSHKYTPARGVHGFLYTVDGLYRFNPYWHFEPYVSAGVGIIGLKPNGYDSKQQGNVNVGIGTQLFVDQSIAFRLEARDIYTMSGGKNDYMVNLGINFLFGGCQHAPAPLSYKGENVYKEEVVPKEEVKVQHKCKAKAKHKKHKAKVQAAKVN